MGHLPTGRHAESDGKIPAAALVSLFFGQNHSGKSTLVQKWEQKIRDKAFFGTDTSLCNSQKFIIGPNTAKFYPGNEMKSHTSNNKKSSHLKCSQPPLSKRFLRALPQIDKLDKPGKISWEDLSSVVKLCETHQQSWK